MHGRLQLNEAAACQALACAVSQEHPAAGHSGAPPILSHHLLL